MINLRKNGRNSISLQEDSGDHVETCEEKSGRTKLFMDNFWKKY